MKRETVCAVKTAIWCFWKDFIFFAADCSSLCAASCWPAAEGGESLLFLPYIMIAELHYHAQSTACIRLSPSPPLGIALGYDITYCTTGAVPNMGSAGRALQSRRPMWTRNMSINSCSTLFNSTSVLFSESALLTGTAETHRAAIS